MPALVAAEVPPRALEPRPDDERAVDHEVERAEQDEADEVAQRMKLLSATDAPEATDAASEYLARFPGGFARADARRLATPTKP